MLKKRASFCLLAAIVAVCCVEFEARGSARSRQEDSVRVVTVKPGRAGEVLSARAALGERLGSVQATGGVGQVDPAWEAFASQFALQDAAVRQYGNVKVVLFRTSDESMAAALVRTIRPGGAMWADLGGGGWSADGMTGLWLGPYAAVLTGPPEPRQSAAASLLARLGHPSAPAPLLKHLPTDGQVAGSEAYVASFEALRRFRQDLDEDVFLLEAGGAEAVVADYEQPGAPPMRLTILAYQTPQLAAAAERRFLEHYNALPDAIRSKRVVRREDNFLVEMVGVADMGLAQQAIGAVDYAYEIKWLKDLPPPLPPVDASIEARQVAQVLISSFAIVGIGLLIAATFGILFGASIFRLRTRNIGNAYSDAGGMICLDLDPALPPTAAPAGLLRAKPRELKS